MATAELRLSKKVDGGGKSQVIVKLTINRSSRPCFKSGVFIYPNWFDPSRKGIERICVPKKGKFNGMEVEAATDARNRVSQFITRLVTVCRELEAQGGEVSHTSIVEAMTLTNDLSVERIDGKAIRNAKAADDEKRNRDDLTFFQWYDKFLVEHGKKVSQGRVLRFQVMGRMLGRYESFVRMTDSERKDFRLNIDTIDKDTLEDFFDYLVNEKSLSEEYPRIFAELTAINPYGRKDRKQVISERGHNVMVCLKKALKTFFLWLNEQDITKNRPFEGIKIGSEKYGTPYYLSLEERNKIYDFDIEKKWKAMTDEEKNGLILKTSLATIIAQRDIFCFQCLIGCRISDLYSLTPSNIDSGVLSYIPRKTRNKRPEVVRVPLNKRALALVEKYRGADRKGRLFPFVSPQRYDDAIKDVVKICGVNRVITKLNSVTGEEEQHPIWEVASSHMARRTFVGNLYKQVKDPRIVGALSGHAENSNAFVRYREIDDDIKREVINLID